MVKGILKRATGFRGVLFGDYSRTEVEAVLLPVRISPRFEEFQDSLRSQLASWLASYYY